MDIASLISQFSARSAAYGECQDTLDFFQADSINDELRLLAADFQACPAGWEDEVLELMNKSDNPWVLQSCAIVLLKSMPKHAVPVLESLASSDGMWKLHSTLILDRWRQMQHFS